MYCVVLCWQFDETTKEHRWPSFKISLDHPLHAYLLLLWNGRTSFMHEKEYIPIEIHLTRLRMLYLCFFADVISEGPFPEILDGPHFNYTGHHFTLSSTAAIPVCSSPF